MERDGSEGSQDSNEEALVGFEEYLLVALRKGALSEGEPSRISPTSTQSCLDLLGWTIRQEKRAKGDGGK